MLTLAAAVALLWLLRPADKAGPKKAAAAADGPKGSWRNRSTLRRAPGAAPQDERPTIQGNVYGADGVVLPGAVVLASTFDRAGNVPSTVGSAKSDAQGRFAISLPAGTYQLTAALSGYGATAAVAQSGDTVSLVLYKSGGVRGHVKDAEGKPVQRFTIDLVYMVPGDAPAPPPAWSKAFESPDGSYRVDEVPAWPVVVRAVAEDRAPGLSAPLSIPSGTTKEVDITLTDGCTLTGKVVDKKGAPIPRVLVNAEERVTAGSMTDPSLQTATQAQSGDDGGFTLEHVPRGTVFVRGYDGDYAVTTTTVQVGDCDKLAPVKLTMSAGGSVAGVARQADGKPIAGALVTITDRATGYVNTTTDAQGRFRFDALPPGDTRIEMEHQGQRTIRGATVKDGETANVVLTLYAAGTGVLQGKVTASGKPLAGVRLLVASNHAEEGLAMYFLVSGEDGSYRLPALPEGQYLVTAIAARATGGTQIKEGEPATVNLDVAAPPPGLQRTSRRTPPAQPPPAQPPPAQPAPAEPPPTPSP